MNLATYPVHTAVGYSGRSEIWGKNSKECVGVFHQNFFLLSNDPIH